MTHKLIFLTSDIRHIHVMGGRAKIFQLLASENVDGNQVDLGVTVLASLGGTHFYDLARATLNHDETVLAKRRALHRIGGGGAGIGALKSMLMLSWWLWISDIAIQGRARQLFG